MKKNAKTIKISVVIPAYNEEKDLTRCLTALSEQDFNWPYEIIVVDNNSTDKTSEVAHQFGVKVLWEKRKGVGQARQTGFEQAKGEIIASSDADTIQPRDWLTKIYQFFKKYPRLVGVSGPFIFIDKGKFFNQFVKILTPSIIVLDKLMGRGKNHFTGMNFAVRKNVFQQVGGFNTSLCYGEDIDLSKRMGKVGRIRFTPQLRVLTSSRRWQINKKLITYLTNYFNAAITGKPLINELPDFDKK
jgi:glycosyltransferase involved in cell wall biosynthesis